MFIPPLDITPDETEEQLAVIPHGVQIQMEETLAE